VNYLIPKELVEQIHAYLMDRPVREVEALIVPLRQLEAAPNGEQPEPEPEPGE
jgi:hypothetical protein